MNKQGWSMNAELIKALREDAEWAHANEWETPITLGDHLDAAADALESLQADHESYQQVKEALQREGYSDIETMISQYKQVMIAANEHDLDRGEEVERLEAQLADSQRREKAAVEDILCRDHCDVCVSGRERDGECKIANYDCQTCKSETCRCRECRDEDKWQWRGPQEAGKGDSNG